MNARSCQDIVTPTTIPQSDGQIDIDALADELEDPNSILRNTRPSFFARTGSEYGSVVDSDDLVLSGLHAELPRTCQCGCTTFTDTPLIECVIEYWQHSDKIAD